MSVLRLIDAASSLLPTLRPQEQRHLTHENVQRKQARTGEEREEEDDEQLSESESEDEDNEIIYNPKNLPLGWDGKVRTDWSPLDEGYRFLLCSSLMCCCCPLQPIPYWLYKLHGLNINYNCEICGNYTYRGPKAFQRHFAVWLHFFFLSIIIIFDSLLCRVLFTCILK